MAKVKQLYGLIGYPVKHSFSAAMHNAAFSALGINAEYRLFEVKPEELAGFMRRESMIRDITGESFNARDLNGFNVTIPHKEAALKFIVIDDKSFGVREINAVNTVKVNDRTLNGFNTDWEGFSRDIKEQSVEVKKAALIGAGGAGKAVAFALSQKNTQEIAVYDIDRQRGEQLSGKIRQWNPQCHSYAVADIEGLKIKDKTLLINASSVGMKPNDPLLVKEEMLHAGLFVYDVIYNPGKTKLLAMAEKKGLNFSNGLNMLLYQGMLAFGHWTGAAMSKELENVMRNALEGELNKCRH